MNSGLKVAFETEFCMVAYIICWSSGWNLFQFKILRLLPDFFKICAILQ